MSEGEGCESLEATKSHRHDAGGSWRPWDLTGLPRNLTCSIAKLDRTLHDLDGMVHVLRAGLAAQTQGSVEATGALSGNITDKRLVALGELCDRANGDVEFIAEIYPAQAYSEACATRGDV